jgi:hypothetical protein
MSVGDTCATPGISAYVETPKGPAQRLSQKEASVFAFGTCVRTMSPVRKPKCRFCRIRCRMGKPYSSVPHICRDQCPHTLIDKAFCRAIKIPDYRLEAELRHYNPGLNCRLCTLIPDEIHN